jgi:hypothetical protein
MTTNNLEILLNAAADLVNKRQLRVVDKSYSYKFFGNAHVTLESPTIRMRLIYDRSQLMADIGSPSKPMLNHESYIDLVRTLNDIPNALRRNSGVWNDTTELVRAIDTHYDQLVEYVAKRWPITQSKPGQ